MSEQGGPGSITLAGLGVDVTRQTTIEVLEAMQEAGCVLHSVADVAARDWVRSIAKVEEDLNLLYSDGTPRLEAYRAMAERAVSLALEGQRVAFVVYGHPCLLHTGVQLTLRRAAEENIPATVLPGISTIDGLLARIGVDPGFGGLHMLESSDLLRFGRVPQRTGHVLILQVGVTGSVLHARAGHHGERADLLLRRLTTLYPPGHRALHFRLRSGDRAESLRWTRVGDLKLERWSDASSLYLPPMESDPDPLYPMQATGFGQGPC